MKPNNKRKKCEHCNLKQTNNQYCSSCSKQIQIANNILDLDDALSSELLTCSKCLKSLPNNQNNFPQDNLKNICKKCRSSYDPIYREQNIKIFMLKQAKQRAKQYNLEFNLDQEFMEHNLKIPMLCPVLNIPLEVSSLKQSDNSPSLDRIDNSKGYTKDNVAVISWRANKLKSNANLWELKAIIHYMEDHEFESSSF